MNFINSLFEKKTTPADKTLYLLPAIVSFLYFVDIILFLFIGKILFSKLIPYFKEISKIIFIFCTIFIFRKYYIYYKKINSVSIFFIYIILFWIYITLYPAFFGWRYPVFTFIFGATLLSQSYLYSRLYLDNNFDFVKISNYLSQNFNRFFSSFTKELAVLKKSQTKIKNNNYSQSKSEKITVFSSIKSLFVNFFDFKGNSTRFEWIVCFIFIIILDFIVVPAFLFSAFEWQIALEFWGYIVFFTTIPFLSISARRLNDSKQSIWWLLILFFPHILTTIFYLYIELFSDAESFLIGISQAMGSIEDFISFLKVIFYSWLASVLYFFYLMIIKPSAR